MLGTEEAGRSLTQVGPRKSGYPGKSPARRTPLNAGYWLVFAPFGNDSTRWGDTPM